MKSKPQILILVGQQVRCGTNYVGSLLSLHPDVITLNPDQSISEFNLFNSDILKTLFTRVAKGSFAMGIKETDLERYLPYYGEGWLEFLLAKNRNKMPSDIENSVFIKSPIIHNWDLWRKAFPDAKIAVLCRDGRDNVGSIVKAANDYRRWHTTSIKLKKRINFYSGRSFYMAAKSWSNTSLIYYNIPKETNIGKFKYEDLLTREGIKSLLDFYELNASDEILSKLVKAPVIGSSWGINTKELKKPKWTPDHDKSKYRFTGKWKKWNPIKIKVFKMLAGKELQLLGYEKNGNW